jgi:hypothetical protein
MNRAVQFAAVMVAVVLALALTQAFLEGIAPTYSLHTQGAKP